MGVGANPRSKGHAAAPHLWSDRRALARPATALLGEGFGLGGPDLAPFLGLGGAAPAFRQLPVDGARQNIAADIDTEHPIVEIDGAGFLIGKASPAA